MSVNTCRRCRAMNHPSREICRGCGAELVFNPRTPQTAAKSSPGGKFIALAALSLVLLTATVFGLHSLGQLDGLLSLTNGSPAEIEREKEFKGREIWDKHLEISGEKGKPQPKSIVMKGTATIIQKNTGTTKSDAPLIPDINGNLEYYYKAPGKIYSRLQFNLPGNSRQLPQTVIVQRFFDGEKGWEKKTRFEKQINIHGDTTEFNRTDKTEQLSEQAVEELKNEMFSRITNGYTSLKHNGTAAVDGKQNHQIFAKKSDGFTDTLYVDAETFLVSKIEFEMKPGTKPDEFVKDVTFSGYRAVNNMQTPFSIYMSTPKMFLHSILSDVVYDSEIDDGIFQLK